MTTTKPFPRDNSIKDYVYVTIEKITNEEDYDKLPEFTLKNYNEDYDILPEISHTHNTHNKKKTKWIPFNK